MTALSHVSSKEKVVILCEQYLMKSPFAYLLRKSLFCQLYNSFSYLNVSVLNRVKTPKSAARKVSVSSRHDG